MATANAATPTQSAVPPDLPCAACAQSTLAAAATQVALEDNEVMQANQELLRANQLVSATAEAATQSAGLTQVALQQD